MNWSIDAEPQVTVQPPFHRRDYRSVIASALGARPFDEESVHDCVCTYVRAERDRGRSPSDVVVALTELLEQRGIASSRVRHALTRQVIPWCVAAYFGGASKTPCPAPMRTGTGEALPLAAASRGA
jgi:hypothetical protein